MVWVKRIISLVALAIVIYLFWPLIGEIRAAFYLIKKAHWIWLPLIIAMQLISYGFLIWLNQLALKPFPGKIGFTKMAALLTSMAFIEVAVPSAGASGLVLRARLLGKYGYSYEAATFSLVLETIYLVIALASIGLLGFIYLVRQGDLTTFRIIEIILVAILLIALMVWLWRVIVDPTRSRRFLVKSVNLWNRFFARFKRLDLPALVERLTTFQTDLAQLSSIPRWKFFASAYGRIMLDVITLGMCFYMFRYAINPSTLFTGYGLMAILSGLAALPGGLGLADASIPVLFSRLGTPGSYALVAGLSYRLLAFWFLRFVGFISWQFLEAEKNVYRADSPTL
jgi:uncharacterized protein (TIRG00374 family)